MYAMNGREPQRLDLAVAPGKSLGWFRLGISILVTVSKLLIEAHNMISTFQRNLNLGCDKLLARAIANHTLRRFHVQ